MRCDEEGIWIPQSAVVDSKALCARLLQHPKVKFIPETAVTTLSFSSNQWHTGDYSAPIVILANGVAANQFSQSAHLPLSALSGQMTVVEASAHSCQLKVPVCGNGHIVPAQDGVHAIGASYGDGTAEDNDACNIAKIKQLPVALGLSETVVAYWQGVRCTTVDHLPWSVLLQMYRAKIYRLWRPTPIDGCPNQVIFIQGYLLWRGLRREG